MNVLIDANFFMIPFQFGVDIFREIKRVLSTETGYEVATTSAVLQEVAALGQKGTAALELINIKNVKVYDVEATDADSGLLQLAEAGDVICTQDQELKRRAESKGIKIITMVNKNHLEAV
jgi:rRNA-processing protein FCF1